LNKLFKPRRGLARAAIAQAVLLLVTLGGGWGTVGAQQPDSTPAPVSNSGLPNLGDGADMTPSAERTMGDRTARAIYSDPDYLDDAVLMEYVQGIWQPLLTAARLRGDLPPEIDTTYAWEVLLLKDREVNAFALPGAYLGLNLGLVGLVTSRDELASVLAHELSHVTQRHIARMMARQSKQTPWMIAGFILGALAVGRSPDAATAVLSGSQALSVQSQLNFSRDMEREADRMGFGVSTQAGFAPQGFVSMFDKLGQANRLNDTGNFPYLRSHPLTTERMADMQSRAELPDAALSQNPQARKNVQEVDQAMMAARARVLSNPAVDALRTWSQEVEASTPARHTPAQQAAVLYGATMAAMKLRDFAQAHKLWQRLGEKVHADPAASRLARLLGVELMLAQNDGAGAVRLLQDGVDSAAASTSNRAELFLAAQAQLQIATKEGAAANSTGATPGHSLAGVTQNLQTWVAIHPRDAQAWQLLASVYGAQKRTLSSIRAQAELKVAQLDYPAALGMFKAAQDWARKGGEGTDHFEASIVDTRTRQVESTIKEQALER